MSITLALVICTFLICATILAYRIIEAYIDGKIKKADALTEYWKGRYYGLAKAFDKGAKVQLTDTALDALRKYVGETLSSD